MRKTAIDDKIRDLKDGSQYKNNEYFKKNPEAHAAILYSDDGPDRAYVQPLYTGQPDQDDQLTREERGDLLQPWACVLLTTFKHR